MKDRMLVALRVLTCIQEHTDPIQSDIKKLKGWISAENRFADSEEVALVVLSLELDRRKKARMAIPSLPPRSSRISSCVTKRSLP
jgi:hypothetical protein